MFCLPAYPHFGRWKGLAENQNIGRKRGASLPRPLASVPQLGKASSPFSTAPVKQACLHRVSPHEGYANIVSSPPV